MILILLCMSCVDGKRIASNSRQREEPTGTAYWRCELDIAAQDVA